MSDKYRTDKWIRSMFPESHWLDPCPIDYIPGESPDGLDLDWTHLVFIHNDLGAFVNPPYSNPLPWVKKAIEEAQKGITVVLLLKHDSSTEWFRLLHEAGAHMVMIYSRLKHCTNRGASFPSVLVVLE